MKTSSIRLAAVVLLVGCAAPGTEMEEGRAEASSVLEEAVARTVERALERTAAAEEATQDAHREAKETVTTLITGNEDFLSQAEDLLTEAGALRLLMDDVEQGLGASPMKESLIGLEQDAGDLQVKADDLVMRARGLESRAQQHNLSASESRAEALSKGSVPTMHTQQMDWWTDNYDVTAEQVVEISTSHGLMVLEFFPDVAPGHVKNMADLALKGFYDGTRFHRVAPGFVIQGGDPNTKDADPRNDGMGGPGYKIKAEFSAKPHLRGTLSMARSGHPDSAGSQFFVCHGAAPFLDQKYTVFGHLLSGYDALDAIVGLASSKDGPPTEPVVVLAMTLRDRSPEDVKESQ